MEGWSGGRGGRGEGGWTSSLSSHFLFDRKQVLVVQRVKQQNFIFMFTQVTSVLGIQDTSKWRTPQYFRTSKTPLYPIRTPLN